MATNPEATLRHFGRCSRIAVKEVEAGLSNEIGHLYVDQDCPFWENVGAKFRLFKGYLKNGISKQELVDAAWQDLDRMKLEITTRWPHSCTQQPGEVIANINSFLHQPVVKDGTELIRVTNDCLRKALKNQKDRTNKNTKTFFLSHWKDQPQVHMLY